jgi:hypothetical protein
MLSLLVGRVLLAMVRAIGPIEQKKVDLRYVRTNRDDRIEGQIPVRLFLIHDAPEIVS